MEKILIKISSAIIMILLSIIAWFVGLTYNSQKELNEQMLKSDQKQNELIINVENDKINQGEKNNNYTKKLEDHEERIQYIENTMGLIRLR